MTVRTSVIVFFSAGADFVGKPVVEGGDDLDLRCVDGDALDVLAHDLAQIARIHIQRERARVGEEGIDVGGSYGRRRGNGFLQNLDALAPGGDLLVDHGRSRAGAF